jgi:hypothetical protein
MHGVSSTLKRMKILMGSFQVCDALNILFELEKFIVKHVEGFILLRREGGEIQNVLKTLKWKFQLKNSKNPSLDHQKLVHRWWEECL